MRRSLRSGARVLVRLPAWLGDHVAAEPIVRALLDQGNHVTAVGPARFAPLLAPHPALTHVPLERGADPDPRHWRGHDAALLLDGSARGAFAAWRAGIPERVGFASPARAPFLTHALGPAFERGRVPLGRGRAGDWPRRLPRPFTSACVELAATAGLAVRDRRPRVYVSDEVRVRVAARLAASGVASDERVLVLHAGARAGSAKGLPPALAARVAASVVRAERRRVVIPCAPDEIEPARAAASELAARLVDAPHAAPAIVLDDPPLDVADLAALHAHAARVITPDSGPRHLAQAVTDAPILVVCGPTDPRHTGEHGANVLVARAEVPCGPCHAEPCPIAGAGHLACHAALDPEVIARAFLAVPERASTAEHVSRPKPGASSAPGR